MTLWFMERRLANVLARHNLMLNPEKCIFATPVIEFVGFRLTADSLCPLHFSFEDVLCLPEPCCLAQLASFLGMTAFYLRFQPRFLPITLLCTLLKQGTPWSLTPAGYNSLM